jgi:hypothetical protein
MDRACFETPVRGAAPLTQLRVGLGVASPILRNPLPPAGGRGKGEGADRVAAFPQEVAAADGAGHD